MPAGGEARGEGVDIEEPIERAVVLPGGDQADPAWPWPGHRAVAERRAKDRFGVGQAGDVTQARPSTQHARRSAPADFGEVNRDDHDGSLLSSG
jgi:hypothetical protein